MFKREIKNIILKVNNTFRILVLTGPRQVGKTTILKELMPKNMHMVSLDNKSIREEAKTNPKFF